MNNAQAMSRSVEEHLEMCNTILKQYSWLTNAYVLV